MAQAAEQLIPVELELGGKDPMLVFDDVNLERAVQGALWGMLTNAGQSCTSVERLYVQRGIYPAFRDRLVALAREITLGVDRDGSADIGRMTSRARSTSSRAGGRREGPRRPPAHRRRLGRPE